MYATCEDGERCGHLTATPERGLLMVQSIVVNEEHRRRGIGSRLYTFAAREACTRGTTLGSRYRSSVMSEGFWAKQLRKGRAVKRGDTFELTTPCPTPMLDGAHRGRRR